MERAFFLLKPDGLEKEEKIRERVSQISQIVAEKEYDSLDQELVEELYSEHREKEFFGYLIEQLAGKPSKTWILEGYQSGFLEDLKRLVGDRDPKRAEPGTIRSMSSDSLEQAKKEGRAVRNLVHRSDSPGAAVRETWIFWDEDIYDINRIHTELDRIIEEQKEKERQKKAYVQEIGPEKAREVAKYIKAGESVLLVGGLKDKEFLLEATPNVLNLDIVETGYQDVIGDIETKLPFKPKSFDHIVMLHLMEILYNPRRAFSEAWRLLKPEGKLWVGEKYGCYSQGLGIYTTFGDRLPGILEELRIRGLVYFPDGLEAFSIQPGLISYVMELAGFRKIETKGNLVIGIK